VLGDVHGVGATLRCRPDELQHHRNEKEGNHIGLPLRKTFGPPKADNLFGRSKRRPYDMWN